MATPDFEMVCDQLIAPAGRKFDLSHRDSGDRSLFATKHDARVSLKDDAVAIDALQEKLYADGRHALLIILQGMDTSGKSGVIRNVFAQTSPLGLQVEAFKSPSTRELAQDYLWRIYQAVPRKGRIGIFDRSHYEDVLVVKVRKLVPDAVIAQRYDQINAFEKHLSENGVTILKFMLNISYETQGIRLQERLTQKHKLWKFNPADIADRKLWPQFMAAYESVITQCSTSYAPWYVVPADSRTRRNAMIARIVRGALESMTLDWPDPGYRPGDFDFD